MTMTITTTSPIQQFISANNLKRKDGLMVFDAAVSFDTGRTLHTIGSQVQVILFPDRIAIYILELLKGEFNVPEMYCTHNYSFSCTTSNQLEIRNPQTGTPHLVCIKPV